MKDRIQSGTYRVTNTERGYKTMADPQPAPNPAPNPNPAPSDPGKGGQGDFDTSKLSDEQLAKVLEDERVWKTKRLQDLREKAKKADEYDRNKSKEEEERLAKEKKHEELAALREKERDEARNKYSTAVTDNAIMAEAAKAGITDLDAAKKLIDRTNVKINDDGSVSGVAEAIAQLVKDKPYIVAKQQKPVGSGTNPTDSGDQSEFTMTQIQDPVFYRKNEAAIKEALKNGKVKEDRF